MVCKYKLRVGSRKQVMNNTAKMTAGGLTKSKLKYNKRGRIVSKKASKLAKTNNRLVNAGYITKKGIFGVVKKGGIKKSTNNKFQKGGSGRVSKSIENTIININKKMLFKTFALMIKDIGNNNGQRPLNNTDKTWINTHILTDVELTQACGKYAVIKKKFHVITYMTQYMKQYKNKMLHNLQIMENLEERLGKLRIHQQQINQQKMNNKQQTKNQQTYNKNGQIIFVPSNRNKELYLAKLAKDANRIKAIQLAKLATDANKNKKYEQAMKYYKTLLQFMYKRVDKGNTNMNIQYKRYHGRYEFLKKSLQNLKNLRNKE